MNEKVLMKGNEALAEAAIKAGCRHYFGYPITPQTEVAAYMSKRLPQIGGTFLQAESEIAAINMVIGVSAAGKRVMTSSSSPGIALKSEGLSYLAGCDLPALIVNVQRGGPGLGGIQPSQSDYFQATRAAGHGDFRMIVLAPASVQEMASLTLKGFDLADKYRMTSMILADGILGQMMEPVDLDMGEVKHYDKPWAVTGTKCKRKHNVVNSLFLKPDLLEEINRERYLRYAVAEENEVMVEEYLTEDADICVVAYGAAARICKNSVDIARGMGIKAGLIRPITLWPFPKNILRSMAERTRAFVVSELSMGQMVEDVELATRCMRPVLLCNRTGGMVMTPEEVVKKILQANEVGGASNGSI
jgi:2-oxoglutarate ferredoxin oxidoreductase subunit alpha